MARMHTEMATNSAPPHGAGTPWNDGVPHGEGVPGTTRFKLRVAVPDGAGALATVLATIGAAIPVAEVTPELQEIDRDELVVQLDVATGGRLRHLPARTMEGCQPTSARVEVLSTWREEVRPRRPRPQVPVAFLHADRHDLPLLARRAIHGGVPTARWGELAPAWLDERWCSAGAARQGWSFAVPLGGTPSARWSRWVAITGRPGRLRFDVSDARAIVDGYGAHPSVAVLDVAG